MNSKTKELIAVLESIIEVCRWHESESDAPPWSTRMKQCQHELENGDYHGVKRLLSAYGGMGSFNDLVVGQTTDNDGRLVWRPGSKEKNESLDGWRRQAYELAHLIKKNRDIGP